MIRSNKSILKTQQRFKSERHIVFTEQISKIALTSNGDKRLQSTYSMETFSYGKNKYLVSKKEEIKCNSIIKL